MSPVLQHISASAEFPPVLSSGSVPPMSPFLFNRPCWCHEVISLHRLRLCHWCPCEGCRDRLSSTLKQTLYGVAILCSTVSSRQSSLSQGSPQVLFTAYVTQTCPFQPQAPQNASDIFRRDQINRNPCRAHDFGRR